MNLFLAAKYTGSMGKNQNIYNKLDEREKLAIDSCPTYLESYHYIHKQSQVEAIRANNETVFLDSGAFSAFSLGTEINIDAYIKYCHANADIIRVEEGVLMASVLDGIGDPQKTYENQLYMESKGIRPLPCFHYGEDPRYLEYYIANYEYITIGGMVGKSSKDLINWLDSIWPRYMLDGEGNARLKVHAFGITSQRIMQAYPWHSVDSSSWRQFAIFGNIMLVNGTVISVSGQSPSKHDAGRHITTLSEMDRHAVTNEVASRGFKLERMENIFEARAALCSDSFMSVRDKINNTNTGHLYNEGLF